jgi:E3 ubiquitin-protein ligase DOA10
MCLLWVVKSKFYTTTGLYAVLDFPLLLIHFSAGCIAYDLNWSIVGVKSAN